MGNVIKKSFQILMKNGAIMQPIILFTIFLVLFNSYVGVKALALPSFAMSFSILSLAAVTTFLSGWFLVIKYAVDNYREFDKNDSEYGVKVARYNIDAIKKFFTGVGEYFLPILGLILLNIIIFALFIYIGQRIFGVSYLQVLTTQINVQTVEEILKNANFIKFLLYVDCLTLVFHFLIMFWIPTLYYKTKNPIKAFIDGVRLLFKNFWFSLGVYVFIIGCFFAINVFSLFVAFLPLLSLLMFIILLYFSAYIFVLLFEVYKQKTLEVEIKKISEDDVFVKSCENKEDENVE